MVKILVQYVGKNPWHKLMDGFNSIHEAATWLVATYSHDADFWKQVRSVRIS